MWFQSTHSLRSATAYTQVPRTGEIVSIHALLAECDFFWLLLALFRVVSIHALLAECDAGRQVAFRPVHRFNPRTPCGVRPDCGSYQDFCMSFNPRTPCGVRPRSASAGKTSQGFQSTHSLRSATVQTLEVVSEARVSIHALLAECDRMNNLRFCHTKRFNPRTPCGVRPCAAGSPAP